MTEPTLDARELDCLVNGELSDQGYRNLLQKLDSTPEGWKRCALAFLEAQALRADLVGLAHEKEQGTSTPPSSAARRVPSGAWALATATCFLLLATWNWNATSSTPTVGGTAWSPPVAETVQPTPTAAGNLKPEGTLQLMVASEQGQRPLQVPYYSAEAGPQIWSDEAAALPEALQTALANLGGQIQVERHLETGDPGRWRAGPVSHRSLLRAQCAHVLARRSFHVLIASKFKEFADEARVFICSTCRSDSGGPPGSGG